VLRLRHTGSIRSVSAEGRPIPRLDAAALERGEAGWTVDTGGAVVKARAGRIEIR